MTIRPIYLCGILALILLTNASQIAQAGVVMTIDNVTLTSGGPSKFVDVNVSWAESDSITSIDVVQAIAEFSIVPMGTNTSFVTFKTYLDGSGELHNGNHQLSDPNYLFANNSRKKTLGLPGGIVDEITNTTFNGDDELFDTSSTGVTLSGVQRLLFRLEIQATGTPTGDEFFKLTAAPFSVLFPKSTGDGDVPQIISSISGGDIRIASAAPPVAVPEPSTGIIMLMGVGMLLLKRRRT
ncbi:MAG: PEP-CTERM sorting domain-containing protein [Planctomyces sp.]|nr:PEP-CTERM sorting domain-containing protein [Planctomyces sp.]